MGCLAQPCSKVGKAQIFTFETHPGNLVALAFPMSLANALDRVPKVWARLAAYVDYVLEITDVPVGKF
jgi:hypothetical protein